MSRILNAAAWVFFTIIAASISAVAIHLILEALSWLLF
jgi:hypothetical protein